jgi:CRP-like cAMP-binding protein
MQTYVRKLERRMALPKPERDALLSLPSVMVQVGPQTTVVKEGDQTDQCIFLAEGFLSRQKFANRDPQIIAIAVPGDAADLQTLWFGRQEHNLVAHTEATLRLVPHASISALCETYPLLMKALWHDTLVEAAIFREWTLNVGHRRARLRVAHLFLEMAARLGAVGLVEDDTFGMPYTQAELASMVGLSLVHFSKSLRSLREEGLIETRGKSLRLLDPPEWRLWSVSIPPISTWITGQI